MLLFQIIVVFGTVFFAPQLNPRYTCHLQQQKILLNCLCCLYFCKLELAEALYIPIVIVYLRRTVLLLYPEAENQGENRDEIFLFQIIVVSGTVFRHLTIYTDTCYLPLATDFLEIFSVVGFYWVCCQLFIFLQIKTCRSSLYTHCHCLFVEGCFFRNTKQRKVEMQCFYFL